MNLDRQALILNLGVFWSMFELMMEVPFTEIKQTALEAQMYFEDRQHCRDYQTATNYARQLKPLIDQCVTSHSQYAVIRKFIKQHNTKLNTNKAANEDLTKLLTSINKSKRM